MQLRLQCLHPHSSFLTAWTLIYIFFVLYIATIGLFMNTFSETDQQTFTAQTAEYATEDYGPIPCRLPTFTILQWFDAIVDLFFVSDFFFRCFLFGTYQAANPMHGGFLGDKSRVLLNPSDVLMKYARTSMLFDAVTGFPTQ